MTDLPPRPPRILLFDSGLGGLTVARAVRVANPEADLLYAADSAAFPYGAWGEPQLVERIVAVMARLIDAAKPDLVVVACNTASTLALASLRQAFTTPFVGTVPAIKPAAAETRSGIIGVLATPGTITREYTKALIDTFAFHCRVVLHGSPRLAEMAETKLKGKRPDIAAVQAEIRPAFRGRAGRRTDVVVLGCTHYPLLLEELQAAAPWPVVYLDPAPAIARRVANVVETIANREQETGAVAPAGTVFVTSQRGFDPDMAALYAAEGFPQPLVLAMPVAALSPARTSDRPADR